MSPQAIERPKTTDEVDLHVAIAKGNDEAQGYDNKGTIKKYTSYFSGFLFIIGAVIILAVVFLAFYYMFVNRKDMSVISNILLNVVSLIVGGVLSYAIQGIKHLTNHST